jgi:two-component system sensor histidine kinase CpxA
MTHATEEIAAGRFEAPLRASRRDELGRLGQAINRMASRLSSYVTGQKRFLGDIAHELCSPIARIQVALGILEERGDPKQKPYVEDVHEEIQNMSSLVDELLSFSKASLEPAAIKLQPVAVRKIVEEAIRRETSSNSNIQLLLADGLSVLAAPELLLRSFANLIRNAIRYAGHAGPITVSSERTNVHVILSVTDCGPGIPEDALAQIFDPFYRLQPARDRESGGVGLGLAIVKTCIESCHGTVVCRNRKPSGLEVLITLPSA